MDSKYLIQYGDQVTGYTNGNSWFNSAQGPLVPEPFWNPSFSYSKLTTVAWS
jgi:hypothetical protein